jgi:mannuronan synthase
MGTMTYEAELQRQHPRYRLPMRATIDGQTYQVHDWSMNGFAIEAGGFTVGKSVMASLAIPFDGYEFGLTVPSEILYSSAPMKRTSFVFLDLEDGQAGLLRYVTDALLSGEVVRAGDILDVARRTEVNAVKQIPAAPKLTTGGRIAHVGRRLAASAGVLAIGAALLAFLSTNVYDEIYVVRSEGGSVSAKTVNVASPAVGRIGFLNQQPEVALGEPLMTINPPVGNPITVQSPCDCIQVDQKFANGDFVKMGEPITRLMRKDAPIVISALVPAEKLMGLYGTRSATLLYADGTRVSDADILWLPGKGASQTDLPREPLTVVIDPEKSLSPDMIGQPVDVTFDLFKDSLPGRAFSFVSEAIASPLQDMTSTGAKQ